MRGRYRVSWEFDAVGGSEKNPGLRSETWGTRVGFAGYSHGLMSTRIAAIGHPDFIL
uniref:Uncharacterized protein n=1 Tax=mine drainage metagenome TaxID=410659 RepID=E6PZP0_9ZZZZ